MSATVAGQRHGGTRAGPLASGEAATVVYYAGARIYFRPLELQDEPLLRRWINDPRNWRTTSLRPPLNAFREREWIESQGKSSTDYVFGIVVRAGNRLLSPQEGRRVIGGRESVENVNNGEWCLGSKRSPGVPGIS